MKCPLCSSVEVKFLYNGRDRYYNIPGEFPLYKCLLCQLIYIFPYPSNEVLSRHYPRTYYSYQNISLKKRYDRLSELRQKVIKANFSDKKAPWYYKIFKKFIIAIPEFINNGKMLDIGCGNGQRLLEIKQLGWNVFGTELSKEAVTAAKKIGLKNVQQGDFLKMKYPNDFFNYVLMQSTIEHIPQFKKYLEKINIILKKGGQLRIITPTTESLMFKIFSKYWFDLETPRHLQIFNSQNISKLLIDYNFEMIKINYFINSNSLVYSLKYLLSLNKQWLSFLFSVFKPVVILFRVIGVRDEMEIYAVKK